MGDSNEQKLFVAKVSLYRQWNRTASRSFLQRNLRTILDAHESKRSRGHHSTPTRTETKGASDRKRREGWDLLSRLAVDNTMMYEALKGQKPVLSIHSLQLRPLLSNHDLSPNNKQSRASFAGGDPDWLPPPDGIRIPCLITVNVQDVRTGSKRSIHTETKPGLIVTPETRHESESGLDVKLDEFFQIQTSQLSVVKQSQAGGGTWHRALDEKCAIEVLIHCRDSNDTAKFLSHLEGRDESEYVAAPGNEGVIKAVWSKFPALPEAGQYLPLKRAQGHKSLDLPYGIDVGMTYNDKALPLLSCNKVFLRDQGGREQLPTPVSDDMEPAKQKFSVKYLFRHAFQTRMIETDDLRCILCPRRIAHSSFERLHLHYITTHEYLNFEVSERDDIKIVRLQYASEKSAVKEAEWEWQAPESPFEIAAHLEGDPAWTHSSLRNKSSMKVPATKAKSRQQGAVISQPAGLLTAARAKRKLLPSEEVQDLPAFKRRMHEVPRVPGINFYRTISKQQVAPGTLICDSDDEVDDSWLVQGQRKDLVKLGLDHVALDFNELLNRHLDEEQPMSDSLTRDALVRFARKFKSKLTDPFWKLKFKAKLDQLQSRHIIGEDTVDYCMQSLSQKAPPTGMDSRTEPLPPRSMDRGDERASEQGATDFQPSQSRGEDGRVGRKGDSSRQGSVDSSGLADPRSRPGTPTSRARDAESESPPPNDVFPDSPRARSPMRSRARRMASRAATEDASSPAKPFGLRTILCTRPGSKLSSGMVRVRDLVTDEGKGKSDAELQPTDLDWTEFIRILDRDLVLIRHADHIVCISNDTWRPVVDENDWWEALRQVHAETRGPIRFELQPHDVILGELEKTTAHPPPPPPPPTHILSASSSSSAAAAKRAVHPCVCGHAVEGVRRTIACANPRCLREFHMKCVQLEKRVHEWRCVDCSSS